ncbi:hypothetical protein RGG33_004435 [Vibrio parahaemolyticus]|nr:hypothetical protein [Vibrio parahaemolyticus]
MSAKFLQTITQRLRYASEATRCAGRPSASSFFLVAVRRTSSRKDLSLTSNKFE